MGAGSVGLWMRSSEFRSLGYMHKSPAKTTRLWTCCTQLCSAGMIWKYIHEVYWDRPEHSIVTYRMWSVNTLSSSEPESHARIQIQMPRPILQILNSQNLRNQRFCPKFDENLFAAKTLFIPMIYFKILVYLNSLFTLAFCFCFGGFVLFCLRQCLAMQANLDFTILLNASWML